MAAELVEKSLEETQETYSFEVSWLPFLDKRLAKLNKKAAKLGCAPIGYHVIKEWRVEERGADGSLSGVFTEYVKIRPYGEAPSLNGWSLVGVLDAIGESDNGIIRSIPGEIVPPEFREVDVNYCDYCKKNRRRTASFILRNKEGEYRQVGRNCLKDFLGHNSPEAVARYVALIASIEWGPDEESKEYEEYMQVGRQRGYSTEIYLSYVSRVIEIEGWLSRAKAREIYGAESTSSRAEFILGESLHKGRDLMHPDNRVCIPEKHNEEHAKAALEWAKDAPGDNEFIHNIRLLSREEVIGPKHLAFVAAIIPSYDRERRKSAEIKELPNSGYFGEIKKREVWQLKLLSVSTISSYYGATYLHKFSDQKGNIAVWFSTSQALEEGKEYTIKGTVKAHEEYRGVKQTVLTRCSVE